MEKKTFTYKDSGVDIKAGEELIHSIKDLVKETHRVEGMRPAGWTMASKGIVLPQTDGQSTMKILLGLMLLLLVTVYWKYQSHEAAK